MSQTLSGNIQRHFAFPSKILGNQRDVLVHLPKGYRRSTIRRYPVFYFHDGQNVFDAATSYSGVEWGADETSQRLTEAKLMEPIIIVAVANTGENRINEYAPTAGVVEGLKEKRSKGSVRSYGRFLIEELKPFIDRKYRTKREREFTGLAGSSLGGLATLALGLWFPEYFTRLAVMSPSVWWDDCAILRIVDTIDPENRPPLKIWLDTGTAEEGWERTRELRDHLIGRGWRLNKDLFYVEAPGSGHSESAWAERTGPMLQFLYPPTKTATPKSGHLTVARDKLRAMVGKVRR
jgi:predicted alpha/beta superfamily hydrolase